MASCRHIILVALLASLLALSNAQFFDYFGGPQSSNLVAGGGAANTRDPRGPITFPPSSPGSETSGVVVGASGFGFVPPNGAPARATRSGPFPGLWN